MHREEYDVVIVGAGPAGTSAAAVLAEKGRRVLLVEKEKFPRYRIGESLIPHCWFPLNRLGLVEELDRRAFHVHKHSVQFVGLNGTVSAPFYFDEFRDHPSSRTWQLERSEFDRMLLDNALAKGAKVREETAASKILWEGDRVVGVHATNDRGDHLELRAPITIDASGRDVFAQSRMEWRVPDKKLKKVALWTYYKGAKRDPGRDAGATTVAYLPDKGWFWYIPLPEDTVSVGVVADRDYMFRDTRDLEKIFLREVEIQPWVKDHLAPGEGCGKFRVTGDYSYRSRHCAADGLVLTGDAFAFLDPVFSSGVFLALHSGVLAGDAVAEALDRGETAARNFEAYGERLCRNIEAMRALVYAFYENAFSFKDLIIAHPHLRADLTECLIGNLDRDFTELQKAMRDMVGIPEPLTHGAPVSATTQ